MDVSISTEQAVRINEIIAVISYENYVQSVFVRLLVPIDKVKSFVITDDFIYGTPLKVQAIVKKVKKQRI